MTRISVKKFTIKDKGKDGSKRICFKCVCEDTSLTDTDRTEKIKWERETESKEKGDAK